MSGWEQVGGDPSPGDVGAIRGAASRLTDLATRIGDLDARMRDAATGMVDMRWMGAGADAMNAAVGRDLPGLTAMHGSYLRAANALQRHAGRLEDLQQRARAELAKHDAAVHDAQAARSRAAEAGARRTSASARIDQIEHDLTRLEAERAVALASGQPTASVDARMATQRSALAAQRSQQDHADSDASSASSAANAADDRVAAARRAIEEIRDEAEELASGTRVEILDAAGLIASNNVLVDILAGVGAGALSILNAAGDVWEDVERDLLALDYVLLVFGTRYLPRDALGRWISPATLSRLQRELSAFTTGSTFTKAGPWQLLAKVSRPLPFIGLGFSTLDLATGLATGDDGTALTGGLGLGTGAAALTGTLAGGAVAVAGGAALLYGDVMLPITQDDANNAYDLALRHQFGDAYDPDNPTAEQVAWATERYGGVWGFFNTISDGMNYSLQWTDPRTWGH